MDQKIWKTITSNMPPCPSARPPSCQDLWKETIVVRKLKIFSLFLLCCKGGADFLLLVGLYSGSTLTSGSSWCDTVYRAVDHTPVKCEHSTESYWAVLSCGTVYYAVQGGSNFWFCGWNPSVWPLSSFMWYYLTTSFPGPLPWLARVKVLGTRLTVYYAVQGGSNF